MYCQYCGKSIPDDSSFCPYCGMSFSADTNEQTNQSPKRRLVIIILILVIAILALVIGIIFIKGNNKTSETESDANSLQSTVQSDDGNISEEPLTD